MCSRSHAVIEAYLKQTSSDGFSYSLTPDIGVIELCLDFKKENQQIDDFLSLFLEVNEYVCLASLRQPDETFFTRKVLQLSIILQQVAHINTIQLVDNTFAKIRTFSKNMLKYAKYRLLSQNSRVLKRVDSLFSFNSHSKKHVRKKNYTKIRTLVIVFESWF